MKLDFSNILSEPREMDGDTIDVVSTSSKSANASPIILKRTDLIQTKFEPTLVDNEKDPKKSVNGKLVYERKRKIDEFPTEKLTRSSIKSGDAMEIALGASETYALYCGLKSLYELYGELGAMPSGSATYTKIDNSFKQVLAILQNDPSAARILSNGENFELVKMLLQIITRSESLDTLKNGLQELGENNLAGLNGALSLERYNRAQSLLADNMDNANEEFWQRTFTDNQWLLSQMFSFPCTIFAQKAYVGGKGITNRGGNLCDYIFQNNMTQNVALIEIKTPCTSMIGSRIGKHSVWTKNLVAQ